MGALVERFTICDYLSILEAARTHGYAFARFTDARREPGDRLVYLRHDIDNCIESALVMAEVESRAGAASTYLAMVRSENYNTFSAANVRRLRRIQALGHEVGLHFEAGERGSAVLGRDLVASVSADARLLELALEAPVRVFSFHNPTERGEFRVEVPGLVNAYADRFFADACYLSESNMRWPHGSPVDVLASRGHSVVQILVHPLSYREDFSSDRDVLLWFIRDVTRRLLALNVGQNRVLREDAPSLSDVAHYLAQSAEP